MASYNNLYWGTLIDSEKKKPSPLLEQLCLGIAKIIGSLESGTALEGELTPARIAAFYRSVGGDYDSLFLKNSGSLSFIYKTLGCWHSLQPVASAFEYPSVPTLTPAGYVRWQTIQLQLDPAEHVPFLQKAVNLYDIPKLDGGTFPKYIPAEALPLQPDEEMVKWWKHVTGTLDQHNNMRRLGSSPFGSPYESRGEARGEYFQQNGRLSASSRPSRLSRSNSEEEAKLAETRRRSSVPELQTPPPQSSDVQRQLGTNGKHPRSHSAQRISNGPYQPSAPHPHKNSNYFHRNSGTASPYRPASASHYDTNRHRRHRSSGAHSQTRRSQRSPSTIHESSGSESSSEDSRSGREKSKGDDRRRSSLWPPSFLHHRRRHSHDATYEVAERKPPLPPRPPPIHTQATRPDHQQSPNSATGRNRGFSNNVRFRDDIFTPDHPSHPASDNSIAPEAPNQIPVPRMWHAPPPPPQNPHLLQGVPLACASTGGNRNREQDDPKRFGAPMRVNTVTGVGGRRYPHGEPRSAGGPRMSGTRDARTMSAAPLGLSSSG